MAATVLPIQFFGQDLHFAISLFAALVFFAVFWLQFDAWLAKRAIKELCKWLGFLLVAASFLISATVVEQSVLGTSRFAGLAAAAALVVRALGFGGIILGQLLDPLQEVPKLAGLDAADFTTPTTVKMRHRAIGVISTPLLLGHLLLPLGALAVAALYFRRATTGLERHYKPVAASFGLLMMYELLALSSLWQNSDNPSLSRLVAAFGPLWILQQIILLASVLLLGSWVWQYLTRRFLSQLFMIFTTVTMAIFLLTTISFTFLLVRDIQASALHNLRTAASVLSYAVDAKQSETTASTQSVAENPDIAAAVAAKDHAALVRLSSDFLRDKKLSGLTITGASGQVLLRAEDPERYGDSLSSDTQLRRALIGQSSTSVSKHDGVLAPQMSIRAAVPIRDDNHVIIGSAVASLVTDTGFVDGVKRATGLDSGVYAGNVRSATTFVIPGSTVRGIGLKETNQSVINTVLKKGQTYQGSLSVQNQQYLAVYTPLKDVDSSVVGMLFIGQPQAEILHTAAYSIELTFVVTAGLLLLSIFPAYFMARYIERQLS